MPYGYDFYFKCDDDVILFPITPGKLTTKIGSKNKVVTLISEGEINILKSPSLMEIKFEARFPMWNIYPYSRENFNFDTFHKKMIDLKASKKPFRFIVARRKPNGERTWDTDILVSLENFEVKEDADEGDDVLIEFNLKQYKEYGVKVINKGTNNKPSITEQRATEKDTTKSSTYTIQSGDTLWGIAKKAYGDGSKWTTIYNANKAVIESAAEKHRGAGSSNGQYIYSGTTLTIPALK